MDTTGECTVTADSRDLLADQEMLADSLERLGTTLQGQADLNLRLAAEIVIASVRAIRIWLESGMALGVVQVTSRERLEIWEVELLDGARYLNALATFIHEELTMSLRERNGRSPKAIRPTTQK